MNKIEKKREKEKYNKYINEYFYDKSGKLTMQKKDMEGSEILNSELRSALDKMKPEQNSRIRSDCNKGCHSSKIPTNVFGNAKNRSTHNTKNRIKTHLLAV